MRKYLKLFSQSIRRFAMPNAVEIESFRRMLNFRQKIHIIKEMCQITIRAVGEGYTGMSSERHGDRAVETSTLRVGKKSVLEGSSNPVRGAEKIPERT